MNIRKVVKQILEEALATIHYLERIYDRFLNKTVLVVGYEIPGTRGQYESVGSYILPDSIKQNILENIKLIENYNFPKSKSYAVKIADIMIDKNLVKYYDVDSQIDSKNKILIFVDEKTESNGNVIYLIVRDGEIKTMYFAKSYVPQDASKMRVDVVIKNIDVIKTNSVRE